MFDGFSNLFSILTYALVAGVALFVIYLLIRSRWKIAGLNEALIVFGSRQKTEAEDTAELLSTAKIVVGGGVFVVPAWQQYERMPLEIMTLDVNLAEVNTKQAIPVRVRGVAQVKVSGDAYSIRLAAQGFLSQTEEEVQNSLRETLAGHLRGVVGTLTVQELNFEREAFQNSVRSQAEDDLAGMGFEIKSFVIQEVEDTKGYMESLGAPQVAEAQRQARIATAEADEHAAIREEQARQMKNQKEIQVDTALAEEGRTRDMKLASIREEVDVANAKAQKAGEYAMKEEDIRIAEREVERQQREFEATLVKKAEAESEAVRVKASADLFQATQEAEATLAQEKARTEAVRLEGAASADAEKARAEAVRELGVAEAEALERHADALGRYDEAGLALESLKVLPEVAAAVAAPLARAGKTTIISSGDGEGTGAVKMAQDGAQVLEVLSDITGLDPKSLLAGLAARLQLLGPEAGEAGEADTLETAPDTSEQGTAE